MDTQLDALIKALTPVVEAAGTKVMTKDEFLAYAADEVKKAAEEKANAPERADARIAALLENATELQKNNAFDKSGGSVKIYSGPEAREKMTAASNESEKSMSQSAAAGPEPTVQALIKSLEPVIKSDEMRKNLTDELTRLLTATPEEAAKTVESKKRDAWPSDMNQDKIDREMDFGVDAGK